MAALPELRFGRGALEETQPAFSGGKTSSISTISASILTSVFPLPDFSEAGPSMGQNILKRLRLCGKGPLQGHPILGKL